MQCDKKGDTCSSREEDPKHCEEFFSWAVIRHRVACEQLGGITNEAMFCEEGQMITFRNIEPCHTRELQFYRILN